MKPLRSRLLITQILVFLAYGLLTVCATYPLAFHLLDSIPGDHGDAPLFYWDCWWVDHHLFHASAQLFTTHLIFYPLGANLSLHTLMVFHALLAKLIIPLVGYVGAVNSLMLFTFVLSAFGAYQLSLRFVHTQSAAFLAGAMYGFCPFRMSRVLGHFNLLSGYGIPFCLVAFYDAIVLKRKRAAFWAGIWLVITAYGDYYFLIYSFIAIFLLLFYAPMLAAERPLRESRLVALTWIIPLVSIILLTVIASNNESQSTTIAGLKISTQDFKSVSRLLLSFLMLRLIIHGYRLWSYRASLRGIALRTTVILSVSGILFLMGFGPTAYVILKQTMHDPSILTSDSGFATHYSADILAFFVPHTLPWIVGKATQTAFQEFRKVFPGGIESQVFVGFLPLIMGTVGYFLSRSRSAARFLSTLTLMSALFALGPQLMVAGKPLATGHLSTPMKLPFLFLSELPLIKGARVPSRFVLLVSLGFALLSAYGFERLFHLITRRKLQSLLLLLFCCWIILESSQLPYPMRAATLPEAYKLISEQSASAGSILELPIGMSSGEYAVGQENALRSYYQVSHKRPTIGGHASRLPRHVLEYFQSLPLIHSLLVIQIAHQKPDYEPDELRADAEFLHIDTVVVELSRYREAELVILYELLSGIGYSLTYWDSQYAVLKRPLAPEANFNPIFSDKLMAERNHLKGHMKSAENEGDGIEFFTEPVTFALAGEPHPPAKIFLDLSRPADALAALVHIVLNGNSLESLLLTPDWRSITLEIPHTLWHTTYNELTLHLEPDASAFSPIPLRNSYYSSPVPIAVRSIQYAQQGAPYIMVNGREALTCSRGLNIVILDPQKGFILDSGTFYSNMWGGNCDNLEDFLAECPDNALVLIAFYDNGSNKISRISKEQLKRLGGTLDPNDYRYGAYAMIGVKNAPPGTALELSDPVEAYIDLPKQRGSLRSIRFER